MLSGTRPHIFSWCPKHTYPKPLTPAKPPPAPPPPHITLWFVLPPRRPSPHRHRPMSPASSPSSRLLPRPRLHPPCLGRGLHLCPPSPAPPSPLRDQGPGPPPPSRSGGVALTGPAPARPNAPHLLPRPAHQPSPAPSRVLRAGPPALPALRSLLPQAPQAPPRPAPLPPRPHLLLEEALAVAQAAQFALLLLVLQLLRGRLEVADEVLQAQDDALDGQRCASRRPRAPRLPTEAVQAPAGTAPCQPVDRSAERQRGACETHPLALAGLPQTHLFTVGENETRKEKGTGPKLYSGQWQS